jgi:hypothetical protein
MSDEIDKKEDDNTLWTTAKDGRLIARNPDGTIKKGYCNNPSGVGKNPHSKRGFTSAQNQFVSENKPKFLATLSSLLKLKKNEFDFTKTDPEHDMMTLLCFQYITFLFNDKNPARMRDFLSLLGIKIQTRESDYTEEKENNQGEQQENNQLKVVTPEQLEQIYKVLNNEEL